MHVDPYNHDTLLNKIKEYCNSGNRYWLILSYVEAVEENRWLIAKMQEIMGKQCANMVKIFVMLQKGNTELFLYDKYKIVKIAGDVPIGFEEYAERVIAKEVVKGSNMDIERRKKGLKWLKIQFGK